MTNNPITLRRLENFKKSRRGYVSFWIFLVLLALTLPAEFIANDKPIAVSYQSDLFFPIFKDYKETEFGGTFETATDFTDPFIIKKIQNEGWIINPLVPFDHQTVAWDLTMPAPSAPDAIHILGTDDQARDVLARVIYGFRISVLFGFTLTLISAIIGVLAGALQGYFGGWVDLIGQRLIEIWSGMPTLYLLIILASIIEPNFWWLLGLLLLFSWMGFVGVVRAEFLRARNFDYVRAARALGLGDFKIMLRHVLPNALVPSIRGDFRCCTERT